MWPLLSGGQPTTVAMHDGPIKDIAWITEMNLLATGSWDKTVKYAYSFFLFSYCVKSLGLFVLTTRFCYFANYFMLYFLCVRYWDTRQQNPVHTQQLPDRCYAMSVRYPLMVVGTADRNLIIFNLKNPQVIFSSKINFHNVLFVAL
jgi:mRNA export factor